MGGCRGGACFVGSGRGPAAGWCRGGVGVGSGRGSAVWGGGFAPRVRGSRPDWGWGGWMPWWGVLRWFGAWSGRGVGSGWVRGVVLPCGAGVSRPGRVDCAPIGGGVGGCRGGACFVGSGRGPAAGWVPWWGVLRRSGAWSGRGVGSGRGSAVWGGRFAPRACGSRPEPGPGRPPGDELRPGRTDRAPNGTPRAPRNGPRPPRRGGVRLRVRRRRGRVRPPRGRRERERRGGRRGALRARLPRSPGSRWSRVRRTTVRPTG
ncbi:hypothetical protein FBY39_0284 [Microbacterium sp. SLBN-146]|nr:hypothetical protein FBY39_0284 [Microbacterium sp. SLBN-146]